MSLSKRRYRRYKAYITYATLCVGVVWCALHIKSLWSRCSRAWHMAQAPLPCMHVHFTPSEDAILRTEVYHLRQLLRVPKTETFIYVAAPILHTTSRGFVIGAGKKDGVKPGQAVITPYGLLGVISTTTQHAARVCKMRYFQGIVATDICTTKKHIAHDLKALAPEALSSKELLPETDNTNATPSDPLHTNDIQKIIIGETHVSALHGLIAFNGKGESHLHLTNQEAPQDDVVTLHDTANDTRINHNSDKEQKPLQPHTQNICVTSVHQHIWPANIPIGTVNLSTKAVFLAAHPNIQWVIVAQHNDQNLA